MIGIDVLLNVFTVSFTTHTVILNRNPSQPATSLMPVLRRWDSDESCADVNPQALGRYDPTSESEIHCLN